MNEFSMASRIFEDLLEFSEWNEGREILLVHLEIGEFLGIDPERLRLCFDSIKQLTPLRHSSLEIEIVPGADDCAVKGIQFREAAVPIIEPGYLHHECNPYRSAIHLGL